MYAQLNINYIMTHNDSISFRSYSRWRGTAWGGQLVWPASSLASSNASTGKWTGVVRTTSWEGPPTKWPPLPPSKEGVTTTAMASPPCSAGTGSEPLTGSTIRQPWLAAGIHNSILYIIALHWPPIKQLDLLGAKGFLPTHQAIFVVGAKFLFAYVSGLYRVLIAVIIQFHNWILGLDLKMGESPKYLSNEWFFLKNSRNH